MAVIATPLYVGCSTVFSTRKRNSYEIITVTKFSVLRHHWFPHIIQPAAAAAAYSELTMVVLLLLLNNQDTTAHPTASSPLSLYHRKPLLLLLLPQIVWNSSFSSFSFWWVPPPWWLWTPATPQPFRGNLTFFLLPILSLYHRHTLLQFPSGNHLAFVSSIEFVWSPGSKCTTTGTGHITVSSPSTPS